MVPRQIRIFVPPNEIYDTKWVETLLGKVIGPLINEFPTVAWFWFSRYGQNAEGSAGDCDLAQIPPNFAQNGVYRSLRFRVQLPDEIQQAFENRATILIAAAGCAVSGFLPYSPEGDMAWERFLGGDYTPERRQGRANLMAQFLCSTSRLMLDMLVGPDAAGKFSLEHNNSGHNPNHSTFESIHHLFCNITEVPLEIMVANTMLGTRMYHHEGGIPVRFERVRF